LKESKFRLSSLFPFAHLDANKRLRLYVRPLLDLIDPHDQTKHKHLKNAMLVSESLLNKLQSSHELPEDWSFIMGTRVVAHRAEAHDLRNALV